MVLIRYVGDSYAGMTTTDENQNQKDFIYPGGKVLHVICHGCHHLVSLKLSQRAVDRKDVCFKGCKTSEMWESSAAL